MKIEMIEVSSVDDIEPVGEELLIWDGCDYHIDYVDINADDGTHFMANNTDPIAYRELGTAVGQHGHPIHDGGD